MLVPAVAAACGALAAWCALTLATPYSGPPGRSARIAGALLAALLCGAFGARHPGPVLPALLYLAVLAVLLGHVDLAVKRLPDRFTLPSYGIAGVLLAVAVPFADDGAARLLGALAGMAALFLVYGVQIVLVPSGIGFGDVKLSGVLGLYLGWFGLRAWTTGLLLTYLVGGLVAVGLLIVRRTREGEFPFGPYMLAGTVAAVLAASP
ncbi:prepilin peptidase [Actinomadura flavalba]|uniref:prepilin peptidase n=1 Tax=Actinomadura flavalba TaxID=1120938 RepID=UPI00037DF4D7|nr:A24 family peptidase [Actinomadura flavalba]